MAGLTKKQRKEADQIVALAQRIILFAMIEPDITPKNAIRAILMAAFRVLAECPDAAFREEITAEIESGSRNAIAILADRFGAESPMH